MRRNARRIYAALPLGCTTLLASPVMADVPTMHGQATQGAMVQHDHMLIAPVTQPANDGIATVSIWLPPGRWFDQNRGELIEGG